MGSFKNLKNKKFNRLTVLNISSTRTPGGKIKWDCICDCNNLKSVISHKLISGTTKSCGCLNSERIILRNKTNCGSKHPKWKGGQNNIGSLAWAKIVLLRSKNHTSNANKNKLPILCTELELVNWYKKQNKVCSVCTITELKYGKTLNIDHNHSTGELRGLLCFNCNAGLGNLQDSIENLESAIQYLKETSNIGATKPVLA